MGSSALFLFGNIPGRSRAALKAFPVRLIILKKISHHAVRGDLSPL